MPPERLGRIGPAVRAIVVAHDPGEWFAESLVSLRDQDYSSLSVTVVDVSAGGDEDDGVSGVLEQVAEVMPDATVMTVPGNPGFGPAVNAAARMITGSDRPGADPAGGEPADPTKPGPGEGGEAVDGRSPGDEAAFLLICHDDVALAPDAVTRLVDESVRRGAGMVGPKIVDWGSPGHLQSVGLSSDRMGVPVPLVAEGEYDQGQHDNVAEVLAVPSACMLIRTEVFDRLGGFDAAMTYHGEDLDLGRRANLSGETVLVVPAATVRHRARLAERRPRRDRDLLSYRHQLRSVLVCSDPARLPAEVPAMLGLTVLEAALAMLTGHIGRAAALVGAWWWNLLGLSEVLSRRHRIGGAVGHGRVERLTRRRYVSLARFVDRLVRGDTSVEAAGTLWGGRRRLLDAARSAPARSAAVAWILIMAVFIFGSRHLLTRGVPTFGEIMLIGESPGDLFRAFFSSWRESGLGSAGPAPTAYGILGVASSVLLGAMGMTRTMLLLGLVPFGAVGLWRLLAPTGSRRAQIVGLAAFVAMPLPYNALANGVWSALAVYAVLPWVCLWLARVVGPPAAAAAPQPGRFWLPMVMVGILVALLSAFVPLAPLMIVMLVAAVVAGGLLAGEARRLGRLAGVAVGGLLLGWLLNLPAQPLLPAELFGSAGGRAGAGRDLTAAELLRFATGSAVGGRAVWGLLGAGALALVLARGSRFVWAARAWSLLVMSVLLALAAEHGWSRWDLPRPEVLLAPGAFGLALAIALGAAAGSRRRAVGTGRRRVLAGAGLVALVAGSVPMLALSLDGQWGMPRGDLTTPLAVVEEESRLGAFRILWVGHPDVLPLGGWELDDRLVYATSVSVPPDVGLRWPGQEPPPSAGLRAAWDEAMSGRTDRMGAALAPLGVRYVILMERIAPEPFGDLVEPVPEWMHDRLGAQFDLERRESRGGVAVYRNLAWRPTRTLLDGTGEVTAGRIAAANNLALPEFDAPTTARGQAPADSTLYLADASDGWVLRVNGDRTSVEPALGWAQSFPTGAGGTAVLRHEPSSGNVSRIVLWALVVVVTPLAVLRRRSTEAPVPVETEPAEDIAAAILARRSEDG